MNAAAKPRRKRATPTAAGCALALVLTLGLAGCATDSVSSRIAEKPAVFASLSPTLQDAVRHGRLGLGYSREMTYLALGKPNFVVASADGRELAWTYLNYNTPEEEIALQNRHTISVDLMGKQAMILGLTQAPKNERPEHPTMATGSSIGPDEGGLGWHSVTGRAELERGEVGFYDETVRQKTAMERVTDSESQDLVITFREGVIVDFRFDRR